MDFEEFVSGYCRCIDGSRMVTVGRFDGQTDIDCNYGSCPYESECAVAERIRELTKV